MRYKLDPWEMSVREWKALMDAIGESQEMMDKDALYGSYLSEDEVGITDVHIIYDKGRDPDTGKKIPGPPKGVIVYFSDGTKEKAICDKVDQPNFNLDFGITICLCKKLMGGSHNYNEVMTRIRKELV